MRLMATAHSDQADRYLRPGGPWDIPCLDTLLSGAPSRDGALIVDGALRLTSDEVEQRVSMLAGGHRPWSEITRDNMWKWPIIMVAFVLASMGWASVTTYTYNTFMLILGYLILFVLIARTVRTQRRLRGLFITLIV